MKYSLLHLITIFCFTGFFNSIIAQTNCAAGTATETLDAANSTITLSSSGIWAFDPEGNTPAYGWPRRENNDGPGIMFTGNLWFGGFDDGGNLKLAAKTYEMDNNNGYGYWPGPLDATTGTTDSLTCSNWDRLFKVNKTDIENFITDYYDNGQLDDPIPVSVLGWPGNGNPFFSGIHGFELPEILGFGQGLAPFFDHNFDGIYDPSAGDYPQINCADQAVWWVFNDRGNSSNMIGEPVKIEIQILAYVYDTNIDNIYNSSFYDVKFINRASEPIDSFFVGIWIDPDLGCGEDDYLGCVPEENFVYVYNQDALDGGPDGSCSGTKTYQEEPPNYGVKLIKKPLDEFGEEVDMFSFNYYFNNSTFPLGHVNPTFPEEYYNYLTGRRLDGAPYQDPSGALTNFLFSGNPSDTPDGWSMCSEDTPNADRHFIMSFGPMRIEPGSNNEFTFAVVVEPQSELPCPDVSSLLEAADLPWPASFLGQDLFCSLVTNTNQENLSEINLTIFPNPATDQLNFQLSENESFLSICLYQMDGKLVRKEEELRSTNVLLKRNDLASGTYFYQVQTLSGNSFSGKILFE